MYYLCKCVLPPGDNPIAVNKYHYHYQKPRRVVQMEQQISDTMLLSL